MTGGGEGWELGGLEVRLTALLWNVVGTCGGDCRAVTVIAAMTSVVLIVAMVIPAGMWVNKKQSLDPDLTRYMKDRYDK